MEDILKKLLSHDSDAVREATAQLREQVNRPDAIPSLCNILSSYPEADIRQYATIILRKRLDKRSRWLDIDVQTREELKKWILQTFIKEPEKSVKNCSAQLIGTILKHDYPNWNELLQFLEQTMKSENGSDKELGFYTLSVLTETCPDEMQTHADSFCALFSSTLRSTKDKASPICYFIMLSMTHMCPALSSNQLLMNLYNDILPRTFEIVCALAEKRPDRACEVLDLYYELAADKAVLSLITHNVKQLVNLCLNLAQKSKNEDLQIKALTFISTLASVRIKFLMKEGLMNSILSVIFAIMKAPPLDDDDEQYFSTDTSEDTLLSCACETLDNIALSADPKKFINPIMEMTRPLLESSDPYHRKGGYLVMGIICQGCEGYIRNKLLDNFASTVYKGVNDPSPVVRNAALFAMGQMAEHLQPEIAKSASEIMPLLISQLDMLGQEGKSGARLGQRVDRLFYAIERFSETIESALTQYLGELIPRLLVLSAAPYHPHIRELALSTVGTAAASVEQAIAPYFNDIMNVLNIYLSPQANPETSTLQVEALDTLGMLARHVGRNDFGPLALEAVKLGLELVEKSDDPDIRKSSYGLFGSVSNVLKEEMGPFLQSIVTPIINSIKDQQAFIVHNRDDINASFPLYDSDEEPDADGDLDDYDIENDYVEEKEEACFALRELALNTGQSFAPHLETSIEEVYKLLNFPSMDVRKAALEAEAQFCISFVQIMCNTSQGDNKLAAIIMEKLIAKTIEMIKSDNSKEVAFTGLECLQTMLKQIGPQIGCLESLKQSIIGTIKDVLHSKTESQCLSESEEDDATEIELLDGASDLIPLLAKAMTQDEFSRVFSDFLPLIRDRMMNTDDDEESDDDGEESIGTRANSIGILAECMSGLGVQLSPYISNLLPYLLGMTKDSDANVRNNSLFAIGEMALHGKEHMYQQYPTVLNALSQVLSTESKPKVLDNACGVIARMILTNIELIPLQQVFRAFIAQLPLKEDYNENIWIMKAIRHVIEIAPEIAQPEVYLIIQAAGFSLVSHSPDDECKEVILNLFQVILSRFPQESQVAIPQLPDNVIGTLRNTGVINN